MARVEVTRSVIGLYYMQVCAEKDATDEEILSTCNAKNPSGTTHDWTRVLHDDDEVLGMTGPVTCADNPDRIHYLVSC